MSEREEEQGLDCYVAASKGCADEANRVMHLLRGAGHGIVHDWTHEVMDKTHRAHLRWDSVRTPHGPGPDHAAEGRIITRADLLAVQAADCVVMLDTEKASRGRMIELGYALAFSRPVVVCRLDGHLEEPYPFYRHPLVRMVPDVYMVIGAVGALRDLVRIVGQHLLSHRHGRSCREPRHLEAWARGMYVDEAAAETSMEDVPGGWTWDSDLRVWWPEPVPLEMRGSMVG